MNVGAGTITCNYDGVNKCAHRDRRRRVHRLGLDAGGAGEDRCGATIGAGSTITKDAPDDKLTLERSKQLTLDGWKRPVKQPKG